MERANFFVGALSLLLLTFSSWAHAKEDTHQITDILGRKVTVAKKIDGLILGESRFIPALGIVVEDAAISRIKGMQADLKQYDPATWAVYAQRFPAIAPESLRAEHHRAPRRLVLARGIFTGVGDTGEFRGGQPTNLASRSKRVEIRCDIARFLWA